MDNHSVMLVSPFMCLIQPPAFILRFYPILLLLDHLYFPHILLLYSIQFLLLTPPFSVLLLFFHLLFLRTLPFFVLLLYSLTSIPSSSLLTPLTCSTIPSCSSCSLLLA